MTPEETDLINGPADRHENVSSAAKNAEAEPPIPSQPASLPDSPPRTGADPGTDPGLGVDWGSNIDPGPGPDPRRIDPGGHSAGHNRAT